MRKSCTASMARSSPWLTHASTPSKSRLMQAVLLRSPGSIRCVAFLQASCEKTHSKPSWGALVSVQRNPWMPRTERHARTKHVDLQIEKSSKDFIQFIEDLQWREVFERTGEMLFIRTSAFFVAAHLLLSSFPIHTWLWNP